MCLEFKLNNVCYSDEKNIYGKSYTCFKIELFNYAFTVSALRIKTKLFTKDERVRPV